MRRAMTTVITVLLGLTLVPATVALGGWSVDGMAGPSGDQSSVLLPSNEALAQVAPDATPTTSCTVDGRLDSYAPTIEDFGAFGGAIAKPGNSSYWSGRGYAFGFERESGDQYAGTPYGGYLYGGIVRGSSQAETINDYKQAIAGWTSTWDPQGTTQQPSPKIGDESIVLTRLTPWEIEDQQPMVEVFLAFRLQRQRPLHHSGHAGV